MKKFSTLLLVLIILSGCSKFKEKRFSTTVHHAFEVDIQQDHELEVDISGTLTSLINEELKKVKDDIKEYDLVGIQYKIWEFYGEEPNTFSGTLGFGNLNSTSPGVTINLTDIDLRAGDDNPNRISLNFNSVDISKLEQYFFDTNGLKIFLAGSVSNKPVHFKLQVSVDIDAIAETKKR